MGTVGQFGRGQASGRSLLRWVFFAGDGRVRAGWRIGLLLVGLVPVYLVSSALLLGALAWWYGVGVEGVEPLPAALGRRLPYWPLLVDVVALPGACAVLWWFRRYLDRRSWRSLGFRRGPGVGWESAVGLLVGVGVIGLTVAPLVLLGAAYRGGGVGSAAEARGAGHLAVVLGALVSAAFLEELVGRGYILSNLAEALGPVPAVLISSAIFAGLHLGNPHAGALGVANIFLAGVLLGTVFVLTGRLWAPWALHLAWNSTLGLVLGIPVSGVRLPSLFRVHLRGSRLLTGGAFGLEASLWNTLALVVTIVATMWLGRRLLRSRALEVECRATG